MVRCWLVERSYGDRNLVTLVYATPDGERAVRKEVPMTAISNGTVTVTAAKEVDETALNRVEGSRVERYQAEAARVSAAHDPDDEI
ncbi:hypothetical protein [Halosegnis sp.]|uniref:hypothetical protein n=1 Tax=Halosegnis sp. TaxID=2864959 RepID=UPI0035D4BBE3